MVLEKEQAMEADWALVRARQWVEWREHLKEACWEMQLVL